MTAPAPQCQPSTALCPFCKKLPGTKVGPPAMARCITPDCEGRKLGAVTLAEWNAAAPQVFTGSARETLRSVCTAGGHLGCSCADQNYQWFGRSCEERMAAAFKRILGVAQAAPEPSRQELVESIQYAIGELSAHIDTYHDFDYAPHQVPPELEELRRLQHHLEGSLIDSKGAFTIAYASTTPHLEALLEIRRIANMPGDRRALVDQIYDIATRASRLSSTERS